MSEGGEKMTKSKKKRSKLVKKLQSRIIDLFLPVFIIGMILLKNQTHMDLKLTIDTIQIEIESDFASDAPVS